jgi:hypothetical protein
VELEVIVAGFPKRASTWLADIPIPTLCQLFKLVQTALLTGAAPPLVTSLEFVPLPLQAASKAAAIKVVAVEITIFIMGMASKWFPKIGGSGEIRTHEQITPSPVFKTGAFNRSATLPSLIFYPAFRQFLACLWIQ